jgi:hypothetical protein
LLTGSKNGRILFDRPKPTAGCSADGRRRIRGRRRRKIGIIITMDEKCRSLSSCGFLHSPVTSSPWAQTQYNPQLNKFCPIDKRLDILKPSNWN